MSDEKQEEELARQREQDRIEVAHQLANLNPTTSSYQHVRTYNQTSIAVKLNGKNYPAWKFTIKKALICRQLTSVVYDTEHQLSLIERERKDAEASELLTNSLDPRIINKIILCETAREIWERLKSMYEQEGDSNLETSIIDWSNMRQGNNESISDYIGRYDEVVDRITSLGECLSERLKRAILVGGLNSRYDGFKRVWNQTTTKTYKKLIEMLFQDEAQLNHNGAQSSRNVALFTKQNSSNSVQNVPYRRNQKRSFSRKRISNNYWKSQRVANVTKRVIEQEIVQQQKGLPEIRTVFLKPMSAITKIQAVDMRK